MSGRHALAAPIVLACAMLATPAMAQSSPASWPGQSVRIVTTHAVGTGIDLLARLYAEGFARQWGQPVVVENRPGGDGITAAASFVATRDGHTLLLSIGAPFTIAPLTHDKLSYDPRTDVTPIALTGEQVLGVAASATTQATSLAELVARTKADPGNLYWAASPGLPAISFSIFLKANGLDVARLTYRDASSPLNDLAEGRLHVYAAGMASLRPIADSGKARLLAVLGRSRFHGAPAVPTAAEAGFPRMTVIGFNGLFGWKEMAVALRDRIATDAKAVAAGETMRTRLEPLGLTALHGGPQELARLLAEQAALVATAIERPAGAARP